MLRAIQLLLIDSHFLLGVGAVLPVGVGLPGAPAGQVGRHEGAVLGHAGAGPGEFGRAGLPGADGGDRRQRRVVLRRDGEGSRRVLLHGSHDCVSLD